MHSVGHINHVNIPLDIVRDKFDGTGLPSNLYGGILVDVKIKKDQAC